MNKKLIIGSLVGGLLVFVWQTLSWTMLNIHGSEHKYTPSQDSILEMLNTHLEDGSYYLPTFKPGASNEEMESEMNGAMGKPWAQISYHKEMNMNMGMNMFRGFVVDFVAVFLLCWLLIKIPGIDMKTTVLSSIAVGIIGYLTTEYTYSIWYNTNSIPDLIDTLISWTLCGSWLGYWLNKK